MADKDRYWVLKFAFSLSHCVFVPPDAIHHSRSVRVCAGGCAYWSTTVTMMPMKQQRQKRRLETEIPRWSRLLPTVWLVGILVSLIGNVESFAPAVVTTRTTTGVKKSRHSIHQFTVPIDNHWRTGSNKPTGRVYGSTGTTLLVSIPSIHTVLRSSTDQLVVRSIFLRALAFIYCVAFTVAWHQNKALLGDNGITPMRHVLDKAEALGSYKREERENQWFSEAEATASLPFWIRPFRTKLFQDVRERLWDRSDLAGRPVTTLFWLAKDRTKMNRWLDAVALVGMALSITVMALGAANVPMLLGLWVLQRSLMAVGGEWYGYGWEPQLAELGFHALFLVPLFSLSSPSFPVPTVVSWMIRWYLFRIMMGAGLIKIKNGRQWRDLTAMDYFYETQPVPNPLSRFFHRMPKAWHRFEVLTNHVVELILPWLLLLPIPAWRQVGGIIQMAFQSVLVLSGNFSFLNWLTIVPAILCLNDSLFTASPTTTALSSVAIGTSPSSPASLLSPSQTAVSWLFALFIGRWSIPVIRNLCSWRQVMNSSMDKLRLVNTYGAFGVVEEERREIILSSAQDIDGPWLEYDFPVKPGNVYRQPRFLSPYHYRLDWQLWIVACFGSVQQSPWLYRLMKKLLEQDTSVLGPLGIRDPWKGSEQPPKYIRADLYRYEFSNDKSYVEKDGKAHKKPYWDRTFVKRFCPTRGVETVSSLEAKLLDDK